MSAATRIRDLFRSDVGTFNMTSIIVGTVLTIALVAGLAVGLTKLIPWGQDMAAKQDLAAMKAAETIAKAKDGRFLRDGDLERAGWVEEYDRSLAETDNAGSCYVAAVASRTGNVFFTTDETEDKKLLLESTPLGDCLDPGAQAQFRTRIAAMPGASTEGPRAGGTMLEYRCDWDTTIQVPVRDVTSETTFVWSDGVSETVPSGSYPRASSDLHSRNVKEGETLTVTVNGTFDTFGALRDNSSLGGVECLRSVKDWGQGTGLKRLPYAFFNAENLTSIPAQAPAGVTDLSYMFAQSPGLSGIDISGWDTSSVTNMSHMFYGSQYVTDLSRWDVSNVTDMSGMFHNYNGSDSIMLGGLGAWNVSRVTNMSNMLTGAVLDNDLSQWDVSRVTDMSGMFTYAQINTDLSKWDTGNVRSMAKMFEEANVNTEIGDWDVSKVADMSEMFKRLTSWGSFNKDIGDWDVSGVTNMSEMFRGAGSFTHDISRWDVRNVTNMYAMLYDTWQLTSDLSGWNVSKVTNSDYFGMGSGITGSPF